MQIQQGCDMRTRAPSQVHTRPECAPSGIHREGMYLHIYLCACRCTACTLRMQTGGRT